MYTNCSFLLLPQTWIDPDSKSEYGLSFCLCISVLQASSGNKNVPILQCHGKSDFMIPWEFGEMTAKKLQSIVSPQMVNFQTYPGLAHCSCPQVFHLGFITCNSFLLYTLKGEIEIIST